MQLPGASDSDGLGFSPLVHCESRFCLPCTLAGSPGEGGSICCWLAGRKGTFAITVGSEDTRVFGPTLLLLPVAS